ncbi:MAG: late competence development ComFB family protein, partial [Leptodesmis sp.]|uniref:late competence development ComFB family protein n=1 Tax=Leptodesmis sp. TaxID=3100501 RepID=UPI003D09E64B
QQKQLPPKIAHYVNKSGAIAYALNRLPPLYATSQKGLQQQRLRATREMQPKIALAVRQALAAIQRDPLRSSPALRLEVDRGPQDALRGLKKLLGSEDLSWANLVDEVEHTLIRTARGEITWHKRGTSLAESHEWQDSRYML